LILAIVLSALFIPSPWNVVVIVCAAIVEVGEVVWGMRLARRWRPQTGPEAMIGEIANVVVRCEPVGQVRIRGELWAASCAAGAEVGEAVRVADLESLTLIVEPVRRAEPGAATPDVH
jgi:membrane protein implicated in regulation of membrane protease activity